MAAGENGTARALRVLLLLVFIVGSIGTIADLLLIAHVEDIWQWAPIAVLGVSVAAAVWALATGSRTSVVAVRSLMLLLVGCAVAGLWWHYRANVEFQLESAPSLAGFELFWEAIQGKSPPSLAPGTLIQFGLLGLVYTYRHPACAASGGTSAAAAERGAER
jgi:hypothetical protein